MWEDGRIYHCYYWALNMLQSGIFLLLELFEEPENQLCVLFEVLPLEWGRNPNWLFLLVCEPKSFSLGLHPEKWMWWQNGHPDFLSFSFSFIPSPPPSSFRRSTWRHAWNHVEVPAALLELACKRNFRFLCCWGGLRIWWQSDCYFIQVSMLETAKLYEVVHTDLNETR